MITQKSQNNRSGFSVSGTGIYRVILILGILLSFLSGTLNGAGAPAPKPLYDFKFSCPDSNKGWGKTKITPVVPQKEALRINGPGKIFHQIALQPGNYLMTATGKGSPLNVIIAKNLRTRKFLFNLNLARDKWRTDWRPFSIKKPFKGWLIVHAGSNKPSEVFIKHIRIDRSAAYKKEAGVPTPAELGKHRPVPEIVRGMTFGLAKNQDGYHDLKQNWHANVIRNFFYLKPTKYSKGDRGGAVYDKGWEKQLVHVKKSLDQARSAGIKVVLVTDWRVFRKGRGSWEDPELPKVAAMVWKGIAKSLAPWKDVIYGYDLYNEPLDWDQMPHPPRQWRAVAKAAIKGIREVDKDTWIIFEPGPGGLHWGFADMKPLPDTKVIYSVHYYSPHEFTHQGVTDIADTDLSEVKEKLNVRYPGKVNGFLWNKESIKRSLDRVREFQQKYNVPIMVGEFSVVRWAPKPDSARYLQDLVDIFEEYHWSWIYHGYRQYNAWDLCCDTTHSLKVKPVKYVTDRAKVIKAGLNKNLLPDKKK